MDTTTQDPRTVVLQRIQTSLRRAEAETLRLRRAHARLIGLSLVATALATVLAGLTAAAGPLAGEGPSAWRWTCALVAVMTAASGLCTGLHQRLDVAGQLARATSCIGRLRALELALAVAGRDAQEVVRDYQELVAQYHDLAG